MNYVHEFEDEEGNETILTEITYDIIRSYVTPDPSDPQGTIAFTHIVRINPVALDMHMKFMDVTKEDVEEAMRTGKTVDQLRQEKGGE